MIESIQGLLDEHADLQKQLADPAVHADQGKARKLGRRYSELNGIVEAYNRVNTLRDDIEAAREMAAEDPDFADEVKELEAQLPEAEEKLRRLLIPRDPDDGRNVILEVMVAKAATRLPSLLLTCCACTPATPSLRAGRPK